MVIYFIFHDEVDSKELTQRGTLSQITFIFTSEKSIGYAPLKIAALQRQNFR